MRSVLDFYRELQKKYDGIINFKKICADEGIIAVKGVMPDGLNGLYIGNGKYRVIILNEKISREERRDWAFHELWHAFKSPGTADNHSSQKEEYKANLFAALCRAPVVREGDTIESLKERYNISMQLAKIRIEHELKMLMRK